MYNPNARARTAGVDAADRLQAPARLQSKSGRNSIESAGLLVIDGIPVENVFFA